MSSIDSFGITIAMAKYRRKKLPELKKKAIKKPIRNTVEFIPRYLARPPQTPNSLLSVRDRVSPPEKLSLLLIERLPDLPERDAFDVRLCVSSSE